MAVYPGDLRASPDHLFEQPQNRHGDYPEYLALGFLLNQGMLSETDQVTRHANRLFSVRMIDRTSTSRPKTC